MTAEFPPFLHFDQNTAGRDFIVGDIHGCFDAMRALMAKIAFDENIDRMFSVGDLVDRGPQSHEAVEWLAKPWFHAVRGNHEQMAIDHVAGQSVDSMYRANGGSWFLALPKPEQNDTARIFGRMPLLIEIDAGNNGLIGIVHADPVFDNWELLKANIHADRVRLMAVWSRTRITEGIESPVASVSAVVVGHTILRQPKQLGNVIFIDTGAIAGNALTMLELTPDGLAMHQLQTESRLAA